MIAPAIAPTLTPSPNLVKQVPPARVSVQARERVAMIFEVQFVRRGEDGRPEVIARSPGETAVSADVLVARLRAMSGRGGWPRRAEGARILEGGRLVEEWWA